MGESMEMLRQKFFPMSNLSGQQLKQVWALADSKRQGFWGFSEFVAAMRPVSLAQAGQEITSYTIKFAADMESIEPPKMEGIDSLLADLLSHKRQ